MTKVVLLRNGIRDGRLAGHHGDQGRPLLLAPEPSRMPASVGRGVPGDRGLVARGVKGAAGGVMLRGPGRAVRWPVARCCATGSAIVRRARSLTQACRGSSAVRMPGGRRGIGATSCSAGPELVFHPSVARAPYPRGREQRPQAPGPAKPSSTVHGVPVDLPHEVSAP